jgi:hypothetical protein
MSGDIRELLGRMPASLRTDQATCEFLDKEIRKGAELNQLQRDIVAAVVKFCVEQNSLLPPPYESFFAHVYLEWTEEAKRSEALKPRASWPPRWRSWRSRCSRPATPATRPRWPAWPPPRWTP